MISWLTNNKYHLAHRAMACRHQSCGAGHFQGSPSPFLMQIAIRNRENICSCTLAQELAMHCVKVCSSFLTKLHKGYSNLLHVKVQHGQLASLL